MTPATATAILALTESHRSLLRARTAMRQLGDAEGADAVTAIVDAVNCLLVTITGMERVSAMEVS